MARRTKPENRSTLEKSAGTGNGERAVTKVRRAKSVIRNAEARAARPRRKTEVDPAGFPIVGIGASAGGLEALEDFFTQVEPDSGMAFIVVTHQAPGRTSLLPELLAKHTRIAVQAAKHGTKVLPNHVYVAPPGGSVSVSGATLSIEEMDAATRALPVDVLFRSLAKSYGDGAIAVILSGNGRDGTLGIGEVKASSGMVMAQEPASARYAGMPASAIATQLVDFVLPPKDMPGQLVFYVRAKGRLLGGGEQRDEPDQDADALGLQRVLVLLRARTGNDFVSYKKSTMRRRIERRVSVHGLRSVTEYAKFLERSPHEIDALFRELLISVTSFFRDPEAYAALEVELIRLIASKSDGETVRVWVPGCATGEEAYSIAILAKEVIASAGKNLRVQIFATDLDIRAVDAARTGRYPDGIAASVGPERLERYFSPELGGYRVKKEVRELLVFASQNLVRDPPFTRLDLLSCRNLLIYLESKLQKRILQLFCYSLRPSGLLFLGTSESVGGFDDVLAVADKKWKIFQRRDGGSSRVPDFQPEGPGPTSQGRLPAPPRSAPHAALGVGLIAERLLLSSFVPPTAIMNERGELIYLHGHTGPFLELATGEPTNNVFNMAREGLRLELPAALRQAAASDAPVVRRGLQVKTDGGFTSVRLTVRKLAEPELLKGTFVATFEQELEAEEKPTTPPSENDGGYHERITSLEHEIQRTKENLQGTIEELETSNEELTSTNEELQSTNEELQSANEELETSREETQSLNEELQTVNSELEERNRALSQANDDMQNLLNSTDIATMFLDEKLAIKRFTTQAKKVFSLIDTDVGRPISDLTANLRDDQLVEEAREVMKTLVFREREVQTKEGAWRLMRIMPYRTHENLIDGLVMTFVDIDRVKRAEEEAQQARIYAESISETVGGPLLVLDAKLRVVSANRAFLALFRTTSAAVLHESLPELADAGWCAAALVRRLKRVIKQDEVLTGFPLTLTLPKSGATNLRFSARKVAASGERTLVILTIDLAAAKPQDLLTTGDKHAPKMERRVIAAQAGGKRRRR